MYFRSEHTVIDLQITLEPGKPLQFSLGGEHQIEVEVRFPTADEQANGQRNHDALCSCTGQWNAPSAIESAFASLNSRNLPIGATNPDESPDLALIGDTYLDESGRIKPNRTLPFDAFPEPFRLYVTDARITLSDAFHRTIRILLWRMGVEGRHQPFSSRGAYWSFDRNTWHLLPSQTRAHIWARHLPRVHDDHLAEVEKLVSHGDDEPLAHQLFREAWEPRHRNPRSALVIGMSAAEVGVKQASSDVLPETKWLLEEMPSPNIHKLIRDFVQGQIPRFNVEIPRIEGTVPKLRQADLAAIRDGMEARNKIIHTGSIPEENSRLKRLLDGEDLDNLLLSIRNVLYLLDFYRGHRWAFDLIPNDSESR